ncbi:D-threonine aldolase [Thalassovita autumnalis]|uniref:D-threonine aldolase n=1 Tax=Thalassovita autumnalis TaxID=2072972 RepID=A0A0P1FPG4_9RHOB|nr:alanine racemase [Thalassovita autumnalis]CUH70156.1 D-threonine aldolase [Thalassovita autumnalis]CUH73209.1 D-threonine aldolase [Thalassovita autumnalis]
MSNATSWDQIDTPAACVDMNVAEANVRAYQAYCNQHGLDLRPHIKTHKLPSLADYQIAQGAVGITCQKISEAEAMLDGMRTKDVDLLITYNILGAAKVARLKALSQRCRLSVVADNATVIAGLAAGFDASAPLDVYVECNTGADRCGVDSAEAALQLADQINAAAGLRFAGLMTYPPAGKIAEVRHWFAEAQAVFAAKSVAIPRITTGGSPDMWQAHEMDLADELRVGTCVYNDRSLVERGTAKWQNCALTVLATVVSVPAENRAVIDAGSKVLTSDQLGLNGHGAVLGRDDIVIDSLSEEHGRLVSDGPIDLQVGDKLRIVPNHVCVVVNMLDELVEIRDGQVIGPLPVAARGQVR